MHRRKVVLLVVAVAALIGLRQLGFAIQARRLGPTPGPDARGDEAG